MITHHITPNPIRTDCDHSPLKVGQYSRDWAKVTCADCLARRADTNELADALWRLAPSMYEMADCNSLAEDLVEDGWRKPDPTAGTRTDGVRDYAEHLRTYGEAYRDTGADSLAHIYTEVARNLERIIGGES